MVHAIFLLRDTVHHYLYNKHRSLLPHGFTTYLDTCTSFEAFSLPQSVPMFSSSTLALCFASYQKTDKHITSPPLGYVNPVKYATQKFSK